MKKAAFKFFVFAVMVFSFSLVFAAEVHCNPKTKVCHKSNCKHYDCKECTQVFDSEQEALKNDYKFCKICSKEKKKESPKKSKK